MRKRILTIIEGILFLTGVSLLLYPSISNYWNTIHQNRVTADYADRVEKMDAQEKDQILKEADQYNQMLSADAGRFTPTQEKSNWYDSLLDADGRGLMGYITIPKIQCKLSVYHGTEDSAAVCFFLYFIVYLLFFCGHILHAIPPETCPGSVI